MPGITTMMDISRVALNTSALQLNTVSHNVANANTEGYSRQNVVTATMFPEKASSGWYGLGVKAQTVTQAVDKLLLRRITDKQSSLSYEDAHMAQLLRLEALSNEASDTSLGVLTTAFFNAWQNVSNNPESSAIREDLLETANSLVTRLHDLDSDINLVLRDLDSYLDQAVKEVNEIAREIASLNKQIVSDEVTGHTANDLRDQRVELLNKMASRLDISWFEDGRGSVTVSIGNGKTIVHDDYPRVSDSDPLQFDYPSGSAYGVGSKQIKWQGTDLIVEDQEISGGTIGAWLRTRDVDIPETLQFLEDFTKTLIGAVNVVHSNGVGLEKFENITGSYGTVNPNLSFSAPEQDLPFASMVQNGQLSFWVYQNGLRHQYTIDVYNYDSMNSIVDRMNQAMHPAWPVMDTSQAPAAYVSHNPGDNTYQFYMAATPNSGVEFAFAGDSSGLLTALGVNTFFKGDNIANINLNDNVLNVSNIAAGRLLANGDHPLGDNSNALIIANLKDAGLMDNGRQTLNESVIHWAAQLGTKISSSKDRLLFAQTTYDELAKQRDNVSAVNSDEELIKLIQFQRAYQAAAKMVSVADTLLETILTLAR
ncbi:MAG: flagellar hook-associated protein FlgK [Desulfarculales bacterium]|jgi:flagellar hook-associated protein 1 FlgK|nr:flagellar hook-associated protein FlgK [Desulfarculales bacterium]